MAKISQSKKKSAVSKQPARSKKQKNEIIDLNEKSDDDEEESGKDEDMNGESNEAHQTKSSFLNECKEIFGTTDLYAVFNLEKSASSNDIKRSYYKLSLKYHPDKVSDETKKEDSKVRFQILGKIYSILSDDEKKKLYDETGSIDGEDSADIKDWESYWRTLFKKVTTDDVDNFFEKYKNSDEERSDLLKFYEKHQGDMNLILEEMFSSDLIEDETRFKDIINKAIENGDVGKYEKFTKESKQKAAKRKANFEKEAKEAEELRKEMGIDESQDSLRKAILARRKNETENFLDHLTEKYSKNGKKNGRAAKKDKKEEHEESEEIEDESEELDDSEPEERPKKRSSVSKKKTTGSSKAANNKQKKVKRL